MCYNHQDVAVDECLQSKLNDCRVNWIERTGWTQASSSSAGRSRVHCLEMDELWLL